MANLLSALLTYWVIFVVTPSMMVDVFTYPRRQDEWERAHPGATYIRYYKSLTDAERTARS